MRGTESPFFDIEKGFGKPWKLGENIGFGPRFTKSSPIKRLARDSENKSKMRQALA